MRIQKHILIAAAALELVIGPLAVWFLVSKKGWELPTSLGWSFLIIGLAGLFMGAVAYKGVQRILPAGPIQTIWMLIVMAAALNGGFFAWQYNILDSCRTDRPFALQLKDVVKSLPHERVAFVHRGEDKVLFYMKWDLPVTVLSDENAIAAFLQSDKPGLIISQGRYLSETVVSMLPSRPAYEESCRSWELAKRHQNKFRAWFINTKRIAAESKEANHAK